MPSSGLLPSERRSATPHGAGIRTAAPADAESLARIYNHYVTGAIVTFETEPVGAADMGRRLEAVTRLGLPWLVAERRGAVCGYAYASAWHERRAYRFTVETTVYLEAESMRLGIGTRLYEAMFAALAKEGIHAAIGKIALPNSPSIALHEKLGFEKVAHLREVGSKFGEWIDVGYWERLLP